MANNYYLILGVPLNAAPDEIRSAFRKLALRCHPDRRSESSPGTFRDISEAYDVLSDPVQRARHDRELRRRRQRVAVVPVSSRIPGSESLISEPVSIAGRPEIVRPSYEALLDRLRSNFVDLGTPKAEREEPLNFELILSREEAERGVLVPFQVPIFSTCFQCGGMGRDWLFPCAECGGEGQILDRDSVNVKVPGGVPDGTVIDISLERLGVHNLWLRVHVRIERH
jgi:molecular chaperone DnaJ